MTATRTNVPTSPKPLRLWPGVVLAIALVLVRYVVPVFAADAEIFEFPVMLLAIMAGLMCAVAIVVWWMFFSRALWSDRLGSLSVMIAALVAIKFVVHQSIAGGAQGMLVYVLAFPTVSLALVAGAAAGRHLSAGPRRVAMIVSIVIGCAIWTLARTEGVMGADLADLEWRWTPTAEERLLAEVHDEPPALSPTPPRAPTLEKPRAADEPTPSTAAPEAAKIPGKPADLTPRAADPTGAKTEAEGFAMSERGVTRVEWPGFRGPTRDSVVPGVQIETDWSLQPPVELWRRPIGPGWSSFAVRGDLLYTQEQRGNDEVVSAYNVKTGEPVWRHRDAVRFWESNGGAGPRGTPAVRTGRVYTMGATGILNALDADNGSVIWSRNAATDTGVTVPDWGIASSPLVVDDVVIVAVSGRLAAYDVATGNQRWLGPTGGSGYSSPHLLTIDGVPQVLLLRGSRTISVTPADGKVLWEHMWTPGVGIVQPAISDGEVLITVGDAMGGLGVRRLTIARGATGWTVEERWTSRGLKPYFNDFVVHEGHAFGFDGSILACIDLVNGERKWKGGRYGNGQLVLLPDQNVLLVMSEEGELALVSATPDKFTEIARFKALDAKTWNHPVLIDDVLLVRNGEEMAAFKLPLARSLTVWR